MISRLYSETTYAAYFVSLLNISFSSLKVSETVNLVCFLILRHERSSDLQSTGRAMSCQVAELMSMTDEEFRTPSYLNMVILTLRNQYSFMLTTLMRLAEDILHWCPILKVGNVGKSCKINRWFTFINLNDTKQFAQLEILGPSTRSFNQF